MKIIMLLLITALLLGASYAAEDNGTADTLTVLDETSVDSLEVEEGTVYDSLSVDDEVQLESSDMDEIMTNTDDESEDSLQSLGSSHILTSNDNEEILGAEIHLNGGTVENISQAILSASPGSIIYLNGATYTGSSSLLNRATINDIQVCGGSFIGDSEMATFTSPSIGGNTALYCYGTTFNNCKFSNIITSNRFIICNVQYEGGVFYGSMTDTTFENCQSGEHFLGFTGSTGSAPSGGVPQESWNGMRYRIYNCNFTNCHHTNEGFTPTYDGFDDGHGQFISGMGIEMDSCNFINTSSGHHSGAICISDESEWGPNYIASSIKNTNFTGVESKWFAIYIIGRYRTSPYDGLLGHEIIENCTFIDCSASEEYGACVGIVHDDVEINNCQFINNTGGQGTAIMVGGISVEAGTVGEIAFNAGIKKGNNISIINCTFINNSAFEHDCLWAGSSSNGQGGAIFIGGNNSTVSGCVFDNNIAVNGSAIFIIGTNITVIDSNFTNCNATNGAIYSVGDDTRILNSIFENCSAEEGGAIYFDVNSNALVSQSSFINNTALDGSGGAIYSKAVNVIVNSSEFYYNSASSLGSAMYNCEPLGCTLDGNSFPETYSEDKTDLTLIVMSGDETFGNDVTVTVSIDSDATENVNLECDGIKYVVTISGGSGSVAISGLSVGTYTAIATYPGDAKYNPSTTNVTFRVNPAVYSFNDLQNLINGASDTLTLTDDYVGEGTEVGISKPITIDGNGHTLDANGASSIIHISSDDVILKNLILTNGNSSYEGGAISSMRPTTLINCTFVNCTSESIGGAVYIYTYFGEFVGCTFVNCSASGKGGAVCAASGNFTDCSFIDCSAIGDGGGLFISTAASVDNCSFINCSTNGSGGAICSSYELNVSVINSTFINNTANNIGSAIYNCDYENCIFEGNQFPYAYPMKTVMNVTIENNVFNQTTRIIVTLDNQATGNINLVISNRTGIDTIYSDVAIADGCAIIDVPDLPVNIYNLTVEYVGDSNFAEAYKNTTFSVLPIINMSSVIEKGLNGFITMEFGDVTGYVTFYIDNKEDERLKIKEGVVNYTIYTSDLSIGTHSIAFKYNGGNIDDDIFKYSDETYAFNITSGPVPQKLASEEYFEVHLEPDAKGHVDFFINGTKVAVVEIVNGVARFDISKFKNGNYLITWRYSGDEKYSPYSGSYSLVVSNKPAKIIASAFSIVYTAKNKYSVKVYDSKGKLVKGVQVSFLINNKAYKTVKTDSKGVARIVINKVPGTYKITSKVSGLSVTKKLTVKHIVSLKKVKVKRSLKKLVIKVSLRKVNGKYLKGKKVTLKFNGKKYKAKTNKKGVAKFTIKSNVLKKLKVGKKVKYQATYLKDTVKKSVKVKK